MKPAAFFRLDHCVISGSSTFYFGKAALNWGVYRRLDLLKSAVSSARGMRGGRRRHDDADAVREHLLAALAGCTKEQVDVIIPDVLSPILAEVRHDMYMRILEHEAAGVTTFLCSPSPIELVSVVADVLNFSGGALATRAAVDDIGRYSGDLAGAFAYGGGLVELVEAEAAKHDIDLSQSWAYASSMADVPLLDAVGKPIVVNPDRELSALAKNNGWQRIDLAAKRPGRVLIGAGFAVGASAAAAGLATAVWAARRPSA